MSPNRVFKRPVLYAVFTGLINKLTGLERRFIEKILFWHGQIHTFQQLESVFKKVFGHFKSDG